MDAEGYTAVIHRAIWERITTMGAPRILSTLWVAGCAYAALVAMTAMGVKWMLVPLVGWAIGQGVLVMLTQWESAWDDMAIAHVTRRYKAFYNAG
jgi:type IV secretory pathway TrbD component